VKGVKGHHARVPPALTRRRDFLVTFLQTELGVIMYRIKIELSWHLGQ
jgi:hypothetical protein